MIRREKETIEGGREREREREAEREREIERERGGERERELNRQRETENDPPLSSSIAVRNVRASFVQPHVCSVCVGPLTGN